MFKEYALDPGLLRDWNTIRYFTKKFGWPHGRLLCEYPKRWKRMVYDAVSDTPVNKSRIQERLRRISDRLISRYGAAYTDNFCSYPDAWLRNAIERDQELPFQAIVTGVSGLEHERILLGDDLSDDHSLMVVAGGIVARRAEEFAVTARLLLQTGETLALVDPHFNIKENRYLHPLAALVETAVKSIYRKQQPLIQLHVGIGSGHSSDEIVIQRRVAELETNCRHFLPRILPPGQELQVFVWLPNDGGERFHNRYILTECAGIGIATGLDIEESVDSGATDDWYRLSTEQHRQRLKQFNPETCQYRQLARFTVSGTVLVGE